MLLESKIKLLRLIEDNKDRLLTRLALSDFQLSDLFVNLNENPIQVNSPFTYIGGIFAEQEYKLVIQCVAKLFFKTDSLVNFTDSLYEELGKILPQMESVSMFTFSHRFSGMFKKSRFYSFIKIDKIFIIFTY